MTELLTVIRRLRDPETGCPWDKAQTHQSLRPYLLEEAAEAVDAITQAKPEAMCEELGDVLLQVALHAVIAEQAGTFDYAAIETNIVEKMVRRHPHIFGDVEAADADAVLKNWQAIKAAEHADSPQSPAEKIPHSLPALMRAQALGKALGWQVENAEARAHTALKQGDVSALLLAVADYARAHGVDAELTLREASQARAEQA